MSEWISVKDRYPLAGYGQILAVKQADGSVSSQYGWLRSLPGKGRPWQGIHAVITGEVTHWMPLPDPPKEKGQPGQARLPLASGFPRPQSCREKIVPSLAHRNPSSAKGCLLTVTATVPSVG